MLLLLLLLLLIGCRASVLPLDHHSGVRRLLLVFCGEVGRVSLLSGQISLPELEIGFLGGRVTAKVLLRCVERGGVQEDLLLLVGRAGEHGANLVLGEHFAHVAVVLLGDW